MREEKTENEDSILEAEVVEIGPEMAQKEPEKTVAKMFQLEDFEQNLNADELLEYEAVKVHENVYILLHNRQIVSEKEKSLEKSRFLPSPKPRIREPLLKKRFMMFLAGIYYSLGINPDTFLIRLLTASCLVSHRFQNEAVENFKTKCILDLSDFTRSREGLLTLCFERTMNNSDQFVIVTDRLNEIYVYQYTQSILTYKELKESQVVALVAKWLQTFFHNQVPREVDSTGFHLNFLKYYSARHAITKAEHESRFPVGSYFLNGVASIEPSRNQVQLLKKIWAENFLSF